MKKLNRKGFTLVELLAVIIILAIVVGITIPAVLTTTNKAKLSQFQSSTDIVADFIEDQYNIAAMGNLIDDTTLMNEFTDVCGTGGQTCLNPQEQSLSIATEDPDAEKKEKFRNLLTAAGVKPDDYSKMYLRIDKVSGRACVVLSMSTTGGYYYASIDNTESTYDKSSSCELNAFKYYKAYDNSEGATNTLLNDYLKAEDTTFIVKK